MSNKKMSAFVESSPDRGGFVVRLEIGIYNFEIGKIYAKRLRDYLTRALDEIDALERRRKS